MSLKNKALEELSKRIENWPKRVQRLALGRLKAIEKKYEPELNSKKDDQKTLL
jgi:hypothetical protein